jgi:hypothetical protein
MSDKTVSNLRIGLGVDPRELRSGLATARRYLKGFAGFAKNTAIVSAAAFGGAAIALGALTKQGLAHVDMQAKLARSMDGSIDGTRALQLSAGDAGVGLNTVTMAMQKIGVALAEAARKGSGPAHEMLQTLGLDAKKLLAMDVDERLATIADRAQTLGFSASQTSEMLKRFGVANKEMSLLVVQGGDAIRDARQEVADFGLSIDSVSAGAIERANDSMSRISLIMEGFRAQLAVAVAPALEAASNQLRQMAISGGPLQVAATELAQSFGELIATLTDPAFISAATTFGVTLFEAVGSLAQGVSFLAQNAEIAGAAMVALGVAMAFFSGPIGLAIAAVVGGVFLLSSALGDSKTAAEEAEKAERALYQTLSTLDTNNAAATASAGDLINAHIDQARAALAATEAEYELAQAEASRALGQAQMKKESMPGNFFADDEISDAKDDISGVVEHYTAQIAARREKVLQFQKTLEGFQRGQYPSRGANQGAEVIKVELDVPDPDVLASKLEALISTLDPTIAKSKQYDSALATLNASLRSGILSQEEYNAHIATLDEKFSALPAGAAAASAGIEAVKVATVEAGAAGEKLEGMFSGTFKSIINGSESAEDALSKLLSRLGDLLLDQALSGIFGGLFSGGFGSLFSSINADGNAFSQGRVMAFANGGVVNGPTAFQMAGAQMGLMGEAGPEAIMPLTRIGGKLGVMAQGGAQAVEVFVHVEASEDLRAVASAAGRDAGGQAAGAVLQNGQRLHHQAARRGDT